MAKKSSEAKKIKLELDKEYESFKSRVAPKMHKRARGRLKRLKKCMTRLKPLKVKEHMVSKAEDETRKKFNHVKSQVSWARKKAASDKAHIRKMTRELQRLRKEIPRMNKDVRMWSVTERKLARKHKTIMRDLGKVKKRVAKEEKRKDKAVKALQKYFQ